MTSGTIRTFGNREQPALSFVEGKNVGGYGCYCRVQCRSHTRQCNIFDMYSFLSVTSSAVVSYINHFTEDDDHLQKLTILSSVICFKQVTSGHDINRSFIWKFDHEIKWKFGVTISVQDQAPACNKFYIIWSEFSRSLSKCYLIHYKGDPWHLTNDQCRRHGWNDWHLEWRMPRTWTHNRPSIKYFVASYGFKPILIWPST